MTNLCRSSLTALIRGNRSRWSSSSSSTTKSKGLHRRAAAMQQKQDLLFSMIESHQPDNNVTKNPNLSNDTNMMHPSSLNKDMDRNNLLFQKLEQDQKELFEEATIMTKSLYRTCIRCIRLLRNGNRYDEHDFEKREEAQKKHLESMTSFSFEPPVDRDNELSSRAQYYMAFAMESFNQEVDCLISNPWREDNVKRFVYLMRQGEERRKWILEDYKFDDPYPNTWNEDRLDRFEERARSLLRKTYHANGWLFKEDFTMNGATHAADADIDWGEGDEENDDDEK